MPQLSSRPLHGTEILDKLDGSGKYRRNAHIFSIQGIRRFNSALHQAPQLTLSDFSEGVFVFYCPFPSAISHPSFPCRPLLPAALSFLSSISSSSFRPAVLPHGLYLSFSGPGRVLSRVLGPFPLFLGPGKVFFHVPGPFSSFWGPGSEVSIRRSGSRRGRRCRRLAQREGIG